VPTFSRWPLHCAAPPAHKLQNTATSYDYNTAGLLTKVTDPLNRITANDYDVFGRHTATTGPRSGVTAYGYDGLYRLVKVTHARKLATTYTIDGLGNLIQTSSLDTGITVNTYARETFERMRPRGGDKEPMWGNPRKQPDNEDQLYQGYQKNSPDCACKMKITFRHYFYVLAAVILVATLWRISRPLDSDPEAFKRGRTNAMLPLCGDVLNVWIKEHGRSPSTTEGLSVLEMKSNIAMDGWERPIVYKHIGSRDSTLFSLYSTGPNGVDENGSGDDLRYVSSIR
jgi:YD repeat-containing protein